jgi:hypothetical protein
MIRGLGVLILAALVALGAVVYVQVVASADWILSIKDLGWIRENVSYGQSYAQFLRLAPADHGRPKIWSRIEFRDEQINTYFNVVYRTSVDFFVVDCTQRKLNILTTTWYSKNNMEGASHSDDHPTGWFYATPGTFGGYALERACRHLARPSHSASAAEHLLTREA